MGTSNWAKQHFKFELLSWIWKRRDVLFLVHSGVWEFWIVYVTVLSLRNCDLTGFHTETVCCVSVSVRKLMPTTQVVYRWLCDHHTVYSITPAAVKAKQLSLISQCVSCTGKHWYLGGCCNNARMRSKSLCVWEGWRVLGRGGRALLVAICRKQKRTWAVNLFFSPCDFNGLTFVLGWGTTLHSSVRVSGYYDWVAPCGGPEVILSGALIWSASIVPHDPLMASSATLSAQTQPSAGESARHW